MRWSNLSSDVVNWWLVLWFLPLVSAQNIPGNGLPDCSSDNLCAMDEACFSFYDLPRHCKQLGYSSVYEKSDPTVFTAYTNNPDLYASDHFIVANYKEDEFLTRECCNGTFRKSCTIPQRRDSLHLNVIIAVTTEGLCYRDIVYEKRPGKTVWCSNTTVDDSEEVFPCMELEQGRIVQKAAISEISFDRDYIADYCFFKATYGQAKLGKEMYGLVYDVADFVLNETNMMVTLNNTRQKCTNRTIENFYPNKIAAELPRISAGETWCFFLKGIDFRYFVSQATCVTASDLVPSEPDSTKEIWMTVCITLAISSVLLIIAAVLIYFYKSTIFVMCHQTKKETLSTIPKCTKDIMETDEYDNLIENKNKPDSVSPEDQVQTSERYTTIPAGNRPHYCFEDKLNEMPEEISNVICEIKIEKEHEKVMKDNRERLDSGMASDVSGDFSLDMKNHADFSESGYVSKYDSKFSMLSRSHDTPTDSGISSMSGDSGISSMKGDSGGDFSLMEDQPRLYALQHDNKQIPFASGKCPMQLASLEEVICNPQDTVILGDKKGREEKVIFTTEPLVNTGVSQIFDDGYIEKDSLGIIGNIDHICGHRFPISSNNNNYLNNADKSDSKLINPSFHNMENGLNYKTRILGDEADLEEVESGENQQRHSASSSDTGCGTNSYDEDEYCGKYELNEAVVFSDKPRYVKKSEMEIYEMDLRGHSELSRLKHSSTHIDSCA